ncbi:MAG: AzlC family ABC transporter permease [Betaproteobacteria bacterium]
MISRPSPELNPTATSRSEFFAGVRIALGATLSYLPFGVICGVAAIQAGMTEAAALAMPALVFGGASQVVVNQLLLAKAPLWVVISSGLIVNLRFIIYSAALARHTRKAPLSERALFAAFLVDHTYAFAERRTRQHPSGHLLAYYLGCCAVIWPTWVLFNALGIYAGLLIPASWQLEFTVPLAFICLMAPMLRDRGMWVAALAGALAGLAFVGLPLKLGLIAACATGVTVGMGVDRWMRGRAGLS